jgi:peptide/nickel transport system permease protein
VDIAAADIAGNDPERAAELREEYGLSRNPIDLARTYSEWIGGIFQGDLGTSMFNGATVTSEIRDRLPVSLELGLIGLLSGLFIAIPLGVAAAICQDRWPDYVLRTIFILLQSVPGFWIAIMIITLASMWWNWAPPLGTEFAQAWEDPEAHFRIMILPALLIGLTPSAGLMRIVRTQMLEVMRQDYVRTARSKGLNERTVIARHAMRNALVPVVTVVGLSLPGLIAGTAIFESIFSLPGMGQYLVGSVQRMDYPVIQSTNLVFAFLIVMANLAVDISYPFLDRRIRY